MVFVLIGSEVIIIMMENLLARAGGRQDCPCVTH